MTRMTTTLSSVLFTAVVAGCAARAPSVEGEPARQARLQALQSVESAQSDLSTLQRHHGNVIEVVGEMADRYIRLEQAVDEAAQLAARLQTARSEDRDREAERLAGSLAEMVEQMNEMVRKSSLEYLQWQQKIQQETREFVLLSSVMKSKHEAAKNAIKNVR